MNRKLISETKVPDEWHGLDDEARANLGDVPGGIVRFVDRRDGLFTAGETWDDAKDILTGFIWDESEDPYLEDE